MNEKFNSNITKRLLSLCFALLFLLSSFVEAFAGTSLENALNKVHLYVKEGKGQQLLTWKGVIDADNFAPAIIVYRSEDGNEYPAYCANPNRPGVEDLIAKSYDVDVDKLDTDPHVWGVITNGYPYKTPQELGLSTEYQAYYATKMAVWATVHANYSNLNDWKANGSHNQPVEAAMKNLVAKGKANDVVYATWLAVNPKSQKAEVDSMDSNYYSQEFEIKSNVKIDSFKIVFDGNVPEGVKATNLQNEEQETFSGDTNAIKVLIPKKDDGEQKGTFNVIAKGKLENKAVMFGISHSGKKQDYYVAPIPFYNGDSIGKVTYYADGTTPPPDEPKEPDNPDQPDTPNTPDIPEPGKGLQIVKVKAGTTQGLSGAVFRLTDADGGIIGDYVTNEQGEISIPDLAVGAYYVEEIVPPEGYVLDENNHKDFIINIVDPVVITFANEEMAELEVKKVDADTGEPLSGASIRVAYDGGSDSYDLYTNDAGTATLSHLKSGTYTVTEITAPDGYLLDSTPQSIKLEAGKKATITVKNKAKPGLLIKKYDEDTGMPLENAEFSVKKKDGSIVYEGMTDKSGQIKIENLEPDWYTITELAPPKGYLIATESKEVKLEPNKVTEIKFDNRLRPALQIMKIDSQTGKALKGAVFKVVKTEDSTESEYTTDDTGTILLQDLDEAIYTVTEVKAPDGYLLDEQHKDIQLEWGKTKTLVFENKARPALEILKIDEATKKPLAGAKFKVTSTEGNTTSEYVTDNTGKILIENLNAEIYTIEEIVAPDGYLLEEQHKDVELEWGKTKQVVFTNKKRPSLEILKVDEATKKPLAGAKFKVTSTEGNTTSEYITDDTGKILIENLNAEIYTIEEIVAPDGYLLEEQHKDIELEWGKTKQVVFTNKKRPILTIQKIDSKTKEPLSGAKFKVTKTEDKTVSEYTTDKTGTITIEKLDESIYTVEEIVAPEGYILEPQHKEIALEWGKNKTLVYEDTRKPTLIITKTNALTYKPIPNTTYKIEYEGQNGGITTLGTYRTDKNGQIILPKVQPGWYIITEIRPAQGINKPSNVVTRKYLAPGENAYTVINGGNTQQNENSITPPTNNSNNVTLPSINKDDVTDKVENIFTSIIENNKNNQTLNSNIAVKVTSGSAYNLGEEIVNYPLNSIVIKKVDANTSELLDGAAFEVRKVTEDISGNSGTIIGRYTTDNSGVIVITGLEPGGYIIEEVKPPTNYLLSENSQQQAWLKADGTSIVEVTFANYPYGSLLVSKTDALTGKPLANAKFKVTTGAGTAAGSSNGEFVTNENGEFLVSNLKPGSYVVTELEAPQNYVLDTTPQTVDIGTDGKVYKLSFKNQPVSTLVILKMDSNSKKPLANAEFKVTTSKGDVVGKGNGIFKTDETGTITIPNLQKGSYIVEEIKSPDGYLLENQSKTIAIDYGKTYTLEFFNKPLASVIIKKFDSENKEPLIGAKFKISKKSGNVIGEYTTDKNGMIQIDELQPGWYTAVEVKAPDGYLLNDTVKDFEIKTGKTVTVEFSNQKLTSLIIKKTDEKSGQPLSGAKFYVEKQNGEHVGEYTTDQDGTINITTLSPDWYVIREKLSPDGYLLDETPKTVEVKTNVPTVVTFTNKKLTALQIKKIDEISGEPLSGAKFIVERQNGEKMGEYTTDKAGSISIPELSPDWYVVKEIKSPEGYLLDETPKTVEIKTNTPTVVTFTNKKLTALQIKKVDEISGEPLSGAKFIVERQNGEKMGEYTTDKAGSISIPELSPDWYVVKEVKSPDGYLLDETPKTVEIKTNTPTVVTFTNKKLTALQIKKVDEKSGEPLSGAKFKVTKQSGDVIGEYTTDKDGFINIPTLEPGYYAVSEMKSPNGYLLDETPKTVEVKTDVPTLVTFTNKKLTALQIKKVDEKSNEPLSGAKFVIERQNGEQIGEYTTDKAGSINIPELSPDWYVVKEIKAPDNYLLDETPKTVEVKTNVPTVITFTNKKLTALQIKKVDEKSGEPLSGAKFKVTKQSGDVIGEYTTDKDGFINVPTLEPGYYAVSEMKAPDGYLLDETPKTVEIKTDMPTLVTFTNKKLTALQIKKVDEKSGEPLSGAKFKVTKQSGDVIGEYTTDKDGFINVPTLEPGYYAVSEMKSPDGYLLDETPKTVEIKTNTPTIVTFTNKKLTALEIKKVDEKSNEPLSGAKFVITKQNGEQIGEYTTDKSGSISIPELSPDWYVVKEVKSPDGYLLDETPKTVEVKTDIPTIVTFTNKKLTALEIKKVSDSTGEPLSGAKFVVEKQNGEQIGEYTTDKSGSISIPELSPDWYVVKEVKAPEGYLLDETPKTVEVKTNIPTVVTFVNKPLAALQIKKVDAQNNAPLAGAVFKVTKQNGELVGEYKTATDGFINIPTLQPGYYTISEMKAPDGYILDETPKTIEIKTNTPTLVTFTNKPLSGLKIIKLDSVTREPLKGVEFTIAKMNGEKVGSYKTDATGMIAVTNLEDGYYTVTETKALEGYISDKEPKTVEIKSGKPTILEVMNEPYPSLVIYKKAGNTGKPLEGVSFLVTKFNGEQIGTYKTDKSGMIVIEGLEEGKYLVKETETVKGYELDTEAKEVDIKYGKRTTLEVVNNPLSSVIIRKIDSVTKEGIYGVTFLLYDEHDNPLGQFISDNEGYVWLDRELEEGKYKLRELQPADGYLPDDVPRTIYVKAGQTTEITWENTPQKGQIVITKRSADYNALTGLPAGSPLAGASFEVYNMTGNLMDKMVSAENGVAASKLLPTGVYMVKEVSAPRYYAINTKELYAEIRHNGDIVKFEFLDSSIDLNLTIDKKGANQISPGQTIAYELYNIKNQSSAVLENFYIHDRIPTDATRVTKIVTGTYSERLYYNITYKTNYKDYRVLAENLLTKNSYEYSLHPNALGLAAGEYVTDVRLEFTKASPGFQSLENMTVFCEVMPTIPKDYKVVNRADCGGRYGNEWESANTSWTTIVWKQDTPKTPLPKTGW